MATAKELSFLLIALSFVFALTESRVIATKKIENDETADGKSPEKLPDDEVDLENFLEDYYDDLWQYLETWERDPGKSANKKKKKEEEEEEGGEVKEGEKGKPVLRDYDYMSDMPAGEPEVDGKKFKSPESVRENLIWTNVSHHGANGSYGDGLSEIVKANRESNSQEEYPLRSKQMRLNFIIDQVLSFRGGGSKMNETIPDARQFNALKEIYEKNIKRIKSEEWTSSYTEKIQSFYPSCEVPKNTEEDLWSDPYSMNLMFDLHYPTPQDDSTIMIVTAKLRLYKLPQEYYPVPGAESSTATSKWEKNQTVLTIDDDRQIRVSVYWYTRSLRRHRVKKKLLDSQMLSLYGARWTEFNIRSAVRTWKESGKNYGLVVNVEDEDGMLLPAEQYINAMNCSKWTANIRPIPSIIMDRVNQYFFDNPPEDRNETNNETQGAEEKHKIYPYQPFYYPIIDLRTREVPKSDVKNIALVNSARKAIETGFINLSHRGYNVTSDNIGSFLKKNNLNLGDITKLSRMDKSLPRKFETKAAESRVSFFQNVPIGSPTGGASERELKAESDGEREEEKEMPRIRHSRKQGEVFQKSINSNSWSRDDYNGTDHH